LASISSFFYTLRILDVVFVGEKENGDLEVVSYNPFEREAAKKVYEVDMKNGTTIDVVFPDKLKDLKGYKYKVSYIDQFPGIFTEKIDKNRQRLSGINLKLMRAITSHQNASINVHNFNRLQNKQQLFIETLNKKQMDLILNTELLISGRDAARYQMVNTYETNGFCMMLPYPPRKSVFSYFMKPFDMWTWILITASLACLVTVWHLLNRQSFSSPDSSGYFLFGFVSFFLGQGIEFHNNRLMQKVLIQLMIMMTFVLGNAYQSVLTSMMAEARNGDRITSIQEAIDSDFSFIVDKVFEIKLEMSEMKDEFGPKISATVESTESLKFNKLAAEKKGIVLGCNDMERIFHDTKHLFPVDDQVADFYYRVPGKVFTYYAKIPTAPYSMFANKLQDYSLRIHESGMKEHWHTLLSFEDRETIRQRRFDANEEFLLNLQDMTGAFYGLCIGLALALISLVLEICNSDVIQHLKWRKIKKACRKRLRCWGTRNRVVPLRIEVRPRVVV
jgi:hypothetical protein